MVVRIVQLVCSGHLEQFEEVEAVTFDYDQRHRLEIECAQNIAAELGSKTSYFRYDPIKSTCTQCIDTR